LGSYLAKELVSMGEKVVLLDLFLDSPGPHLLPYAREVEDQVVKVGGDLSCWPEVLDAVKSHGIERIIHCGAFLSHKAETYPSKAFEVNMLGTWYILEIARILGVKQVMFTSTIATFGDHLTDPVDNTAPQYPHTIYGVTKVSSERLGEYYKIRFGLDFRGVRLPSVIGPGRGPGGVSAYSTLIVEKPALGEPYEVFVEPRCRIPLLYIKDAVSSLLQLSEAREESLNYRMYNVAGFSPTAGEMAETVMKIIPEAEIIFTPQQGMVRIADSWPDVIDDTAARTDWNWETGYDLDKAVKDFIAEVQRSII